MPQAPNASRANWLKQSLKSYGNDRWSGVHRQILEYPSKLHHNHVNQSFKSKCLLLQFKGSWNCMTHELSRGCLAMTSCRIVHSLTHVVKVKCLKPSHLRLYPPRSYAGFVKTETRGDNHVETGSGSCITKCGTVHAPDDIGSQSVTSTSTTSRKTETIV